MKLIIQNGEVDVDRSVLMENFEFFEMFEEVGMNNDESFDMRELPLTQEVLTALIALSTT